MLHRDGMMLVIDKPAGLAVHAGPGKGGHLMELLGALRFGLPRPPELAHRLDRDTSGCLVLGRHRKALARLGELFAGGRVEKVYWAVTVGRPPAQSGTIDKPLLKLERRHGWRVVVDPRGQPSVTDYRVLGGTDRLSWIEARPRTGRTHQIRVHLAAIGCPIIGDSTYGRGTADLVAPNLHLHARAVSVPIHSGKPPITATAPVPPHMRDLLAACGWGGE
ncbi:RluA family pseudouridine synthase [Magnetospirillum sp. UT-4]|uniref:RluA family pseudouridine synthase n=1 Tax=Magnetospirillum sp. UT-4 TaxID=2681467 RepID=UPI00352D72C7